MENIDSLDLLYRHYLYTCIDCFLPNYNKERNVILKETIISKEITIDITNNTCQKNRYFDFDREKPLRYVECFEEITFLWEIIRVSIFRLYLTYYKFSAEVRRAQVRLKNLLHSFHDIIIVIF
jgi:hypothetical protein